MDESDDCATKISRHPGLNALADPFIKYFMVQFEVSPIRPLDEENEMVSVVYGYREVAFFLEEGVRVHASIKCRNDFLALDFEFWRDGCSECERLHLTDVAQVFVLRECEVRATIKFPPPRFIPVDFLNRTGQYIGKGGYGKVELVTVGQTNFAVKKIHTSLGLKGLESIKNEYIASFLPIYNAMYLMLGLTRVDDQYGIITLYDAKANIDITTFDRYQFAHNMAQILRDVHWYGIIHGDIKPSNIVFDRLGDSYYIDFGSSQSIRSNPKRINGTPRFMGPEIRDGIVTPAVDWYGLGVTVLVILEDSNSELGTTTQLLTDLGSDDLGQRNNSYYTRQTAWNYFSYQLNRLWTKICISQCRNFQRHSLIHSEENAAFCHFFNVTPAGNPDSRTRTLIAMKQYSNNRTGDFIGDKYELEWNLLGSYQDHYEWWWSMFQCFNHESIQCTFYDDSMPYEPTIAIDLATLFRLFLRKQKFHDESDLPFWHCLLHVGLLACESASKLHSIFFEKYHHSNDERNNYNDNYWITVNQTLYEIDVSNKITRIERLSAQQ